MARKRHSAEQIINKLREAEAHLGQGMGVTEQTYYRWRKEYGGPCSPCGLTLRFCGGGAPSAGTSC